MTDTPPAPRLFYSGLEFEVSRQWRGLPDECRHQWMPRGHSRGEWPSSWEVGGAD